jgi:hypothetical protein
MPAAVVHLVRAANGLDPLREFLDAYARHPAGAEHELVLLLKGFASEEQAAPHLDLAGGLAARSVWVDDRGYDLTAYQLAAQQLDAPRMCFLNSYSRPLADGWLEKLARPLSDPGVGLTGCGGSNESACSAAPFWLRPLRRRTFPPFPNPHLRSNGFMLERTLLLDLRWPQLGSKVAAWAFESGRSSLAQQVWARGLEVLVVGADGVAYPRERWRESATFRSGGQRNLLIADNRTRQYERAGPELRRRLELMAWGQAER